MTKTDNLTQNKGHLTKYDGLILIILSVFVWLLAASSFGFLSVGFDKIYLYAGNDDLPLTQIVSQLIRQKWIWNTQQLGAPYGQQLLAFPSSCLQTVELLLLKFWSLFTQNVPVVINLQLCFTFSLCVITSYVVLRKMKLGYVMSVFGAVLFTFSPYIYGRSTSYSAHYCLAACYFIPLSVYLCRCCYFENDFLRFDKKFICRRNLMVFVMCFLIANNGNGYYSFFTCFFLCVTGFCKCVKTGKICSCLPAVKTIVLIVFFFLAALAPVFYFQISTGINPIHARPLHDLEYYSMKITQLFIPLFSHGIGFVQNFVNTYNRNMPAVNENQNAYLGVIAGIGFLFSMLSFFLPKRDLPEDDDVELLSKLNLAAVLFMTIGGFISLLCVILGFFSFRSVNRVSIFIMFISIVIICRLSEQYVFGKTEVIKIKPWKKITSYLILLCVMLFGLWDQTPQLWSDGSALLANKAQWDSDKKFIHEIESKLQPGDMVYQIPYHEYPEGRTLVRMGPYHHLIGFIHSDTLKWSFGGLIGTKSGEWNEYMERISPTVQKLIENVSEFGFKGIYIDSRGYVSDDFTQLLNDFEDILGYQPIKSDDDVLYFFNLHPFLEEK